jgi:hypothetical protein
MPEQGIDKVQSLLLGHGQALLGDLTWFTGVWRHRRGGRGGGTGRRRAASSPRRRRRQAQQQDATA